MFKVKTAAAKVIKASLAVGVAAAATVAATGTAHATTAQYYVEIISHEYSYLCLQVQGYQIGLATCNSADPNERFDVISYASDVNNYYSRVVIEEAHDTTECLSWNGTFTEGTGVIRPELCTSPAGSSSGQHWNMTWVGNGHGNPSNSFQFFNPAGYSYPGCLDVGQPDLMFDTPGAVYCPNQSNKWQIWSLVN